MRYDEPVWAVWDILRGWIADDGHSSLPLIFDNENDALDVADESQFWEVHKISMHRIGGDIRACSSVDLEHRSTEPGVVSSNPSKPIEKWGL